MVWQDLADSIEVAGQEILIARHVERATISRHVHGAACTIGASCTPGMVGSHAPLQRYVAVVLEVHGEQLLLSLRTVLSRASAHESKRLLVALVRASRDIEVLLLLL